MNHPDAFTAPSARSFLRALLPELSRRGAASIFELQLAGRTCASQIALHAPGCSYVHASASSLVNHARAVAFAGRNARSTPSTLGAPAEERRAATPSVGQDAPEELTSRELQT